MIQLIERARNYKERTAIKSGGEAYTYQHLLSASESIATQLLKGRADLEEARIAFLVDPSFDYVSLQWGIWRAGGVAVPLCTKHPLPSIQYVLQDTQAEIVIFSKAYEELLSPLFENESHQFIALEGFSDGSGNLPDVPMSRRAMILYTSGTTGNPKGVVSTHQNIEYQITSLTTSWEWQQDDHILNVLPMHHVHGIVNVTLCALWSGACCEFLPKFDAGAVLGIFSKGEVNVFMAVPTIYFKLIAHWKSLPKEEQETVTNSLQQFRLMVSGSAALPISVLEQWRSISGQTLLERYGMTEMGMAISNPYRGERRPGYIGQPLANVTIRIADESNQAVEAGTSGEIQVQGPNVFKEYWQKPEATTKSFTEDGWFKTGDIAVFEEGSYRILGRNSVDIIKSGGYKISALEIEEVLRSHPEIKECGVVGLPDDEWGEIIGACLITDNKEFDLDGLKEWLKERLPRYQLPRKYIFEADLPRNVMGKVTKKELKKMF
ncbi:MAG: AMP-binding protein [Saprospiraceae bacterium]|nr:AMP-binding protein [Saprospiraceae bacterium]